MYDATIPSLVARDAFLLALAIPLVRRIVSALVRSPPASSKARLQSIMPAFVFSRSCLTSCGVISGPSSEPGAVVFAMKKFLILELGILELPRLRGYSGHFQLLAD